MEILQSISLDFARKTLPIKVFAKQYDQNTRFIEITPLKFGQKYTIESGVTVRLQLTKPDNTTVITDATITNNIIKAELSYQALAAAGTVTAEIGLYKGETLLSSQVFYIDVERSAYDANAVKSSNEFNLFIDALNKVEPAVNASENATKNATDAAAAANTAATAANTAKTNANKAATAANNAANSATDAAEKANTATNSVDEAKENANNAAITANASATAANEAAAKAEEAATAANTAAGNANENATAARCAADAAEETRVKADIAAESANTAATNATEAAERANTATNLAIEAKDNANAAADNANAAAERVENAVQAAETATEEANTASENAQNIADILTEKLNNGEFVGAQGVQGEKGNDGFSPIVSVTPLENRHKIVITDNKGDNSFDVYNGEKGEQGLPGKDGKDYILTDSDKQEIADIAVENAAEAANKANSAAETAQNIVDLINEKLANGEFNGTDYILTAADKTEIAKLVEPLASSIQGGTVTYEIPKEGYEAAFFAFDRNNTTDPNITGINIYIPALVFRLAEIVLDGGRFEADLKAGIAEEPPGEILDLPIDEQIPILEEYYKDYMTISQRPWCPNTIKPLLYYALVFEGKSVSLQQMFRNDINIQVVIKRKGTEERTIIVANPNITSASEMAGVNFFYPVGLVNSEFDTDNNVQTIQIAVCMLGNCPKYASDNKYATADDTIEEVTFTFIPNNTFVEADKDESV